ncbi:MAG: hypothetical protein U9R08_01350, partial [Nanoarchaeota archaeon]|nr:hypothetical protein [Nanoarchaeota archaeon]
MTIVGVNFKKINVEKNDSMKGKISIKNNILIKDVVKHSLEFGDKKRDAIKFIFDFVTTYDIDKKNLAKINLEGDVMSIEKADVTKYVLDKWKKDKKLDDSLMALILNTALVKCNIQALILSKEMNLPSPIPLPKITA